MNQSPPRLADLVQSILDSQERVLDAATDANFRTTVHPPKSAFQTLPLQYNGEHIIFSMAGMQNFHWKLMTGEHGISVVIPNITLTLKRGTMLQDLYPPFYSYNGRNELRLMLHTCQGTEHWNQINATGTRGKPEEWTADIAVTLQLQRYATIVIDDKGRQFFRSH